MAISDTSKIDLLYKKLFGVAKTDTATNKGLGNESIASPSLIRGDRVWSQSGSIPATGQAVAGIVQAYQTTSRIECTAITSAVPISSVYPSWNTNLTDWIPPEFGSDYFVKVYVDSPGASNPVSTGTQISDSGSGSTGEWYFDYQAGVLNFIGGTIPAALTTSKVIFVTGYRYIGTTGVLSGSSIANTAIFANVSLSSNVANTVLTLSNFTTANLTEGSNKYFTNARVVSALIAGDYITIEANGRISANVSITSGSSGSSNSNVAVFAYLANVANTVLTLNNFTTANLAESINLYYTNARVVSATTSLLTTANVVETTNQYFTNARVVSALTAGQNIIIEANGRISANVSASTSSSNSSNSNVALFAYVANVANTVLTLNNFTTANLAEGINLYYTNARTIGAVTPLLTAANIVNFDSRTITTITPLLTTANVVETTNQYFTNVRVLQAVNPLLTTANVVETTNQYFTNVRVLQAVTPLLTTANVSETTNRYFTNARVYANVELMSINVFADVDITGIQNSGILQWNGTQFIAGTVSAATTSNTALFSYLADRANTAGIANTVLTLNNFTTANLTEGTNLYFTNSRAAIGLTGQDVSLKDLYVAGNLIVQGDTTTLNVATLTVEDINITIAKNASTSGQADGAGLTISGADATLLYKVSGDKFEINKNFTVNGALTANTWNGLYTSNVVETTNQYYTNARVYANVELMSINVFADVDITGIGTGGYLEWNGTKFIPGNLAGKLTTANVNELTNLYFTNARAVAAIQNTDAVFGNLRTTGLLTVSSATGAESVTGIEFTNNPVGGVGDTAKLQYYGAGSGDDTIFEFSVANNPGDSINFKTAGGGVGINRDRPSADFDVNGNVLIERILTVQGTVYGQLGSFNSLKSNSLVINGSEIISSDGTLANISVSKITANTWIGLYTSNVIETGSYLYFTNARLQPYLTTANVVETTNQYFTNVRVLQVINPLLTTANVVETTNQYFTNARVLSNVEQMSINVFADVDITGIQNNGVLIWNGTKFVAGATNSERANVANTVLSLSNFTTSDLKEGSNLYFTYSRVVNTVTPLLTTSNVTELTNQYFTNTRVLQAVTPLLTTANVVETTNQYYTNARVYANVEQMSINVFADVDITGITTQGILQWNGTQFVPGTIAQSQSSNLSLFAYVANVANLVLTLSNFTTANLTEGNNQYFTNTRVTQAVTGVALSNLTVSGNVVTSGIITSDISANKVVANSLVLNNSLTSSVKITNIVSPNATLITKFSTSNYRTAEFIYTIIGKNAHTKYNAGKILMLHDNANVYFNQYGILLTGDGEELVTFSADINNSNVRLFATVTSSDIVCDVRLSGTTYTET